MSSHTGSPCGACKFLRRKCSADCVFAPYFQSEPAGAARFTAIHKVFGASNAAKMLLHVPVRDRHEAVLTIAYEAQARIKDPVYGCVSHIFALQQQVVHLQAQLIQVKGQLAAQSLVNVYSRNAENDWKSSMVSGPATEDDVTGDVFRPPEMQSSSRKRQRYSQTELDLGELQALASTIMKNY